MRSKILGLCVIMPVLGACSNHADPASAAYNRPNPICAEIKQKLAGSATENIPSYRTVTATERTELIQQFHDLGCLESSEDSADESD